MIISFDDSKDAASIKDQISADLPPESLNLTTSRGFGGTVQSDLLILLTTIAPLVIQKLAELLSKMVKTKGEREVKINGVSIKGYNVEDVIKVLKNEEGLKSNSEKN